MRMFEANLFDKYHQIIEKKFPNFLNEVKFYGRNLFDLKIKLHSLGTENVDYMPFANMITEPQCYYSEIEECLDNYNSNEAKEIKRALWHQNSKTIQLQQLEQFVKEQMQTHLLNSSESSFCLSLFCFFNQKESLKQALQAILDRMSSYSDPLSKERRGFYSQMGLRTRAPEPFSATSKQKESEQPVWETWQSKGEPSGRANEVKKEQPHTRLSSSDDSCIRYRGRSSLSPF